MQIFQLKLVFKKKENYIDKKFYYSILGAVLNLLENDKKIYDSILKISYSFDKEHLFVFISVLWKNNFNFVITKLLSQQNKEFSIDSYSFLLEKIDFNLKVLDLLSLNLNEVEKFSFKFLSPTQIRNQNKIFTLPQPDRFLFSGYQKLKILWLEFNIDEKDFKKWLSYSILPKQFDIKTDLVEIKKSPRAGVVWNISYIVYEKNEKYQQILSAILQAIPYIWLGSGTKLWLGNVKTFHN